MRLVKKLGLINLLALVLVCGISSWSLSGSVNAELVRPVEDYCNTVIDGNPDGVGGSGNIPDVCTQDAKDKAAEDKGLLAEGGIVSRVFDLMSWLTGLLAFVFILVGGFKITTSGGNKDSVKSARNMIIYALVGLGVILLSNLIFNLIIGIVKGAS